MVYFKSTICTLQFFIADVNGAQHNKTISLALIDYGQMENWLFAIANTLHTFNFLRSNGQNQLPGA